ncbi:TPA: hypothetical protein HA241_05245, partial [Candidatus Woesearchaeota archaeon]|nr:hypothetical protein [Candidatus Woesearchaeota archaeon]
EFVLDHYCDNGQWTTRTKEVAMKLYEVGQTDEFVLYCSHYDQTLPDFEVYGTKIGRAPNHCFSALSDVPSGVISPDENTCINSVCVLQKKSGNDFITAFATTLNREINDAENPFLESLGIPKDKLNIICQGNANNGYVECALDQTGVPGSLYYNPSIMSIIYSKEEGFAINPSLLQRIAQSTVNYFKTLFGAEQQTAEATFVGVDNADKLYFFNEGGKKVQAVQQLVPGKGEVLVARYEGFETPVCAYITNAEVPPDTAPSVFDQERIVQCTVDDTTNTQRVEITSNPDAFWPALTGGLRVNSEER